MCHSFSSKEQASFIIKVSLILWLQSLSTVILEPKKIKSVTVSIFSPSICQKVMDQMPWSTFSECWVLSQLFHSPLSLSAIRVVPSAYLRLLIFLLEVLIPAFASSSPTFCVMYPAYKLNKQGNNIQPWHTLFPIWNQSSSMSGSNSCFLTWIQISQEAGKMIWYSCLFKNFPVCCVPHSQRLWCNQ